MRRNRAFGFIPGCWFSRACHDYARRSVPCAASRRFLAKAARRDLGGQCIAAEAAGADAATDAVGALPPSCWSTAAWCGDRPMAQCVRKGFAYPAPAAIAPSVLTGPATGPTILKLQFLYFIALHMACLSDV